MTASRRDEAILVRVREPRVESPRDGFTFTEPPVQPSMQSFIDASATRLGGNGVR